MDPQAKSAHHEGPSPAPTGHLWGPHLFVPANRAGYLTHLLAYRPASVILDLEYATLLHQKLAGRHLAAFAVAWLREQAPALRVTVRVNGVYAWPWLERDLEVLLPFRPAALRLPAVTKAEEIQRVDFLLSRLEAAAGLEPGVTRLQPMIENPRGLFHALAIAEASPRNEALCLGGEDWAHACGKTRSRRGDELLYVRSALVAAAAEAALPAIDTVYSWLDDPRGFRADCQRSRRLGFVGRAITNPRQLASARELYRPTAAQWAAARQLLANLSPLPSAGGGPEDGPWAGLWASGGRLLDPRAVHQARMILTSTPETP